MGLGIDLCFNALIEKTLMSRNDRVSRQGELLHVLDRPGSAFLANLALLPGAIT